MQLQAGEQLHHLLLSRSSLKVTFRKVDRTELDKMRAVIKEPKAPLVKYEIWGGITETHPNFDDPKYIKKLNSFYTGLFTIQRDLILDAIIELDLASLPDYKELAAIGIVTPDLMLPIQDWNYLVSEILYQSTVTTKGLLEAEAKFSITWMDKSLRGFAVPGSMVDAAEYFTHWKAAQFMNFNWHQFCDMPGPLQSDAVYFYTASNKLDWMNERWKNPTN